jgi:ribosomal protein L14E/L6E/L27E
MTPGQVVVVKAGRDKGRSMAVISTDGEYVYLADGGFRTLGHPKKKKTKHVQTTNTVLDFSSAGKRGVNDADLRKWLSVFQGK